ncbi:DEAD/DEAH box helicase [Actinomadura latina]|uniref:DEAD/DEAH box helicase family protein n=1 Tax=Actinomadura latina TaxID=163603 RepID=A0A846YX08_9ACTN|nr:helicase C-terminal domain-containing protein [Actinomadura latina]NKZ03134.1 DEAD/DEAH box helicase family protein [Actinomadura latina]
MAGLNFGKLNKRSVVDTATEPRRIFAALPARDPKYARPWDVQTQVWDRWHDRRTESDLLVKMNTGGGKTVVGLMMLKSCLNEGAGPAIYIAPDIYLADQVRAEADALGMETTDDPHSGRFQSGKAILVTYIHKVVNGLSVFGVVGDTRQRIEMGSVLVDDTHACLATLEEQFTLTIPRGHEAFSELIDLFDDTLRDQSPTAVRDLLEDVPGVALRIPYWTWADRRERVLDALHPHRKSTNAFTFVWPLIHEVLHLCDAAISYSEIEIKPPCPPIDRIASLAAAKRRIFMTATLADDSVLVTHFDAAPATIATPITPQTADDLGDRMILTPLETHPGTTDEEVRDFLVEQAQCHNVVVIVPSRRRAAFWRDVASAEHDSTTIHEGVRALRDGHVGLVVLINKYDGIDLPGDACRILALDGLPEAYSALDRIEALALDESDAMITRQIQRIEQGMGRGVRSNDDYCVVLLLGPRLTQRLHKAGGTTSFSPATRAQLDLSEQVADMLHGMPFSELGSVINQCLGRDTEWVTASRDALDGVTYPAASTVSDIAVAEREGFRLAELGRYREAHDKIREAINAARGDRRYEGWLKQRAAGYLHLTDPAAALQMQKSAQTDNKAVLRPRDGVEYHRLSSTADQARQAAEYLTARYSNGNDLIVGVAAVLEAITPDPDPASVPIFEQAMHDLGLHLGFGAQRPERDTGEGPDVLWSRGELAYLVIECKSGGTTDSIWRHDAEQLSHSMDWFAEKYDHTCTATPVLLHNTHVLHKQASARPGTRVITFAKLAELREAVSKYAAALAADNGHKDFSKISSQLATWSLNGKAFIQKWGATPRKQ